METAAPESYESEKTVVFTPSDTKEKDYSQVSGWNEETGTVTRSVKVVRTEELKDPTPEETPEEKPEDNSGKDEIEKPQETPQQESG